jgi:hypothetical protein
MTMRNLTLSEAAAEILKGSVSKAPAEPMHKQEGSSVQNLGGDTTTKVADKNPDASVAVSKAKEPGTPPPVKKEEKKSLKSRNPEVEVDIQARGTNRTEVEDDVKEDVDLENENLVDLEDVDSESEDEIVAEESEDESEDDIEDDAPIFDKEAIAAELKEQLDADLGSLLEGDELSEEFKTKARTVFEAAVLARTNVIVDMMEAKFAEELEEAVEGLKEDLSEKTNAYLDYIAEQWMKDNEIAIESSLRSELTEDFIAGLKQLFVEHYIDVTEDKVDVVGELTKEVEDTQAKLSEEIARGVELAEKIKSYQKTEILAAVCEGLTDVQKDKMKSLAEGVEFTAEGDYREKMDLIRENYFSDTKDSQTKDDGGLNEPQEIVEEAKKKFAVVDPLVEQMAAALNRSV